LALFSRGFRPSRFQRTTLKALVSSLVLCGAPAAHAAITWVPRGAFADRQFTSLVSPPNYPCDIAFTALGNGGLGVSTDCGVSYATLITTNAYAVTAKSTDVGWVAAGMSGVVKSVNGGASWFQVNAGLPAFADARAIDIHLAGPDTIYAGFHGNGVYVGRPAADSTQVWTAMNNGLGDLNVLDLVRVRGGTYFLAAADGGIWRWSNGSWSPSTLGIAANHLVIDSADSSRCYAACGMDGVYRSMDAGQSFQPSSNGLPAGVAVNDIVRRTDNAAVLYVGTAGSGVYESIDYGDTWHPFGPAVPGDNNVTAVLCVVQTSQNQANVFAGTMKDGLFEAQYSTPVEVTTWGRLKAQYR
jgi:photosystem II stability/assembly factor-like uncharacterized protein